MINFTSGFLAGLIVATFFVFGGMLEIIEIIESENEVEVTVHGRPIPKCDKELWERITDGCE